MEVQIITPDKTIFSGSADSVVVPGSDGQIGILDNHAPLVSSIQKGHAKQASNCFSSTHQCKVLFN